MKSAELASQGRDNPRERWHRDQDRNAAPVRPQSIIGTACPRRRNGIEFGRAVEYGKRPLPALQTNPPDHPNRQLVALSASLQVQENEADGAHDMLSERVKKNMGLSENSNPRSMIENESGKSSEFLSLNISILTHSGYNRPASFCAIAIHFYS